MTRRRVVAVLRLYRLTVRHRAGLARPCCARVWGEVAADVQAALEYLAKHKKHNG